MKIFCKLLFLSLYCFSSAVLAASENSNSLISSNFIMDKISGIGQFSEAFTNKFRSYFQGTPIINGVELFEIADNNTALRMLSDLDCHSVDPNVCTEFGLTHLSEEQQIHDPHENLVLPWKGSFSKITIQKYSGPSEKHRFPCQIALQCGPERPSSVGNFIFAGLLNFDLNKKENYSFQSAALNTTARGFFGDQSGWLKNIELMIQLGSTYNVDNGFSRYEIHKFDENLEKTTAMAATTNEYYISFEGLLGVFYQHSSNRFRSGIFWSNNNYFNISKSSSVMSNANRKDDIKDYTGEFDTKVKEVSGRFSKTPLMFKSFGFLSEVNFLNGDLTCGLVTESIQVFEPEIIQKACLKAVCLCLKPYLKVSMDRKISNKRNLLCHGTMGMKSYFNSANKTYEHVGQSLFLSCQLNF